jgi:cytochrome c peroxidase
MYAVLLSASLLTVRQPSAANCQSMGRRHLVRTIANAMALASALAVFLTAGGSIFGAIESNRYAWQEDFQRPAEIPFPASNPYSEEKYDLGRTLFFDPILSRSEIRSCGSCHNPGLSWADGRPRAIGEQGQELPTRTPTLLNVAWTPKLGWDGHFHDLEGVAFGPITATDNMDLTEGELIGRLSALPAYGNAFKAAFGEAGITRQKIELALATFERTIVSDEAPFDRWIGGDESAISESAKRGFDLFNGKGNCAACHSGWAFTDASFHDIGSAINDDIGRGRLFPTSVKLQYAFKTPTLRDVARRGPYMHNGSVPTLAAVIALYNGGGIDRPSRADEVHQLDLLDTERADLVAFLQTLTGSPERFAFPELPR